MRFYKISENYIEVLMRKMSRINNSLTTIRSNIKLENKFREQKYMSGQVS